MGYKRFLISLSLSILGIMLSGSPVFANASPYVSCQAQYDLTECNTGSFSLNKTVQNPQTKQFVDNLGTTDPHYAPEATLPFRITIQNVSDATIGNLTVTDALPRYTSFQTGPGSFNAKENMLTYTFGDLKPGETRTLDITLKAAKAADLPQEQTTCVTNRATATSGSLTKQDDSQVCIANTVLSASEPTTKGGLKVFPEPTTTKTPPTGPEAILLLPLVGSALSGLYLRKRSLQ